MSLWYYPVVTIIPTGPLLFFEKKVAHRARKTTTVCFLLFFSSHIPKREKVETLQPNLFIISSLLFYSQRPSKRTGKYILTCELFGVLRIYRSLSHHVAKNIYYLKQRIVVGFCTLKSSISSRFKVHISLLSNLSAK